MSKKQTRSLGLNAIGKPYGANYDPNYRMNHKPSYGHLRWPYLRVKFVGEELREASCRKQQSKSKSKPKETATATLSWKENARTGEFTARAPAGSYILSPLLHCWNVDFRKKVGRRSRGPRQQLDFARTLDEAEAIAEADSNKENNND
jgi:hypothetical protein